MDPWSGVPVSANTSATKQPRTADGNKERLPLCPVNMPNRGGHIWTLRCSALQGRRRWHWVAGNPVPMGIWDCRASLQWQPTRQSWSARAKEARAVPCVVRPAASGHTDPRCAFTPQGTRYGIFTPLTSGLLVPGSHSIRGNGRCEPGGDTRPAATGRKTTCGCAPVRRSAAGSLQKRAAVAVNPLASSLHGPSTSPDQASPAAKSAAPARPGLLCARCAQPGGRVNGRLCFQEERNPATAFWNSLGGGGTLEAVPCIG